MLDADNPSSIRNCLFQGRELGRAQRGAITAEMYQELNSSWLELDEASEDAASQLTALSASWSGSRPARPLSAASRWAPWRATRATIS